MGRQSQEINIIVHYPTTCYGWLDLMWRLACIEPDRLYDAIKRAKCSKANKALLLQRAQEHVDRYQKDAYRSYERHSDPNTLPQQKARNTK